MIRMRDDLARQGYLVPAFDRISSSGGEGNTYLSADELRDAVFVGDNDDDTKPEYNYDHLELKDGRKLYLITADLDYDNT